ncbi:GmrSD restriction endonuclease domain-containing protein, partial [Tenacibaculum sp. L6]|uniref:GmrSD restriction endonuclease domain-containing protein n=1 Tax=Tenacibaculum sp. L6 TaxID=2992764 RepID=UPI00237BE8CA
IATQTENPKNGYDVYDEEFRTQFIDCLGNYLLLSKSHNCSVGNKPFSDKRDSYTKSNQQREIAEMTKENA